MDREERDFIVYLNESYFEALENLRNKVIRVATLLGASKIIIPSKDSILKSIIEGKIILERKMETGQKLYLAIVKASRFECIDGSIIFSTADAGAIPFLRDVILKIEIVLDSKNVILWSDEWSDN